MSLKDNYVSGWDTVSVSIAVSQFLTELIDVKGLRLFAIVMPSAWTAANLTFQTSMDGGTTWNNLKDQNGNEIVAVASVSDCIILDPSQFAAIQYLRVRSGNSGAPVAQGADRSLTLVLRSI